MNFASSFFGMTGSLLQSAPESPPNSRKGGQIPLKPTNSFSSGQNGVNHDQDCHYAKEIANLSKALEDYERRDREFRVQAEESRMLLEKQLAYTQEELKARNLEVERVRLKLQDTERLLEARRAEMERPLSDVVLQDKMSMEEVIQLVRDLNTEIVTLAANIARDVSPRASSMESHVPRSSTGRTRLPEITIALLTSQDHAKDPTILQIVIQSILTRMLARIFTNFCVGLPSDLDSAFQDVYTGLLGTGEQATAARWRSLAHSRLSAQYRTREIFQWLISYVVGSVSEAMSYSRCTDEDARPENLRAQYGSQIVTLVKDALSLVDMFREGIFSTDFQITIPQFQDEYYPLWMEDIFPSAISESKILLTTELGLFCETKVPKSKSIDPILEQRLLIRPRVVLDSVRQTLEAQT